MKKKSNIWFWLSPVIAALLVLVCIRLVTDVQIGYKFWKRPISVNLIEITFAIIIGYIFQAIIVLIFKRRAPINELSIKKLLVEYLYILIIGLFVINPGLILIHYITKEHPDAAVFVIANVIFSLIILIFFSFFRGKQILDAYVSEKLHVQEVKNMQTQTELKFLKAQFQPHFLFNALNTIYFQIDEKNEAPRRTIEMLTDLLRYQLYDVNTPVSVKQEYDFISTYIDFQKIRMKKSLKLDVSLDSSLNDRIIHPLLLFPFVENAIKYVGGEYWIRIVAKSENDCLFFKVTNSIPHDMELKTKRKGIGLENLKRRLELLYHEKYELRTNKIGDTFVAELKMKL